MSPQNKRNLISNCRKQWRNLGFYIDHDPIKRCKVLTGSYNGLLRFANILTEYSRNSLFAPHASSANYGPYANLRIMTHDLCGIDQTNIYGTRRDIYRLARLVEDELSSALPGDHLIIREQYHPKSVYGILLVVCEDQFDPASLDPEKWMK